MKKASLLHKDKYLMSQGEASLSQYQKKTETSVLPPTLGKIPLVQVPQTGALNQQVSHSHGD